jgi:hypothetical protein
LNIFGYPGDRPQILQGKTDFEPFLKIGVKIPSGTPQRVYLHAYEFFKAFSISFEISRDP